MPTTLVLCSASPRRRDLLAALGLRFEVVPSHVDETQREGEAVLPFVERLARDKAREGLRIFAGQQAGPALALAADTVVVAPSGEVLGKPVDRADTLRMLGLLSGVEHRVITAVCVGEETRVVETRVRFRAMTDAQLRWLAASGDGDDKAGAYAVQGLAGLFVERIEGSFTNVVGLPTTETLELLERARLPLPWEGA